jgi:aerobic carbon-monoxide dehydrogenase small subunit
MRAIEKPVETTDLSLEVNGTPVTATVPARRLLVDFLRDDLGLTGTHAGCEHGVCGACTILMDGAPVRSCIMLAPQADGSSITTIEGITPNDGLNALQQEFKDHHALQCGFCTPGILMTVTAADPAEYPDQRRVREMLSGNICRCTGYQNIVQAVTAYWGRDADD